MTEIPLFPLSAVLVPHGRMPLQIFERRYLDLVRDCMRESRGFGVIWIRRGPEVAAENAGEPELGDYGTYARIVDWDQLPNGLLGITIEGGERFELENSHRAESGLVMGEVEMHPIPEPEPVLDAWQSLVSVLRSLEGHPHVQRMGLSVDYNNAWDVAYTLVQLLPLEEQVKYELLGADSADVLVRELEIILNEISGED
jgi:Lon protease-like protein